MSWACYVGQPIEFKARYEGTLQCISDPDSPRLCRLKHVNLGWLEPDDIHIGKGFHVRPDLPHGLTYYGPEGSFDLELVLTGPGLSPNGRRVTFAWVTTATCLPYPPFAATYYRCKTFMDVKTVESTWGTSKYIVDFVSGYTHQQAIKGTNQAIWRICYDGPFELPVMAPFPRRWELGRVPLWIEVLTSRIDECADAPACGLSVQGPTNTLNHAIARLIDLSLPEDHNRLRYQVVAGLEQSKAELQEADSLLKRSEEVASAQERRQLRTDAASHLERAREVNHRAMDLIPRLEGAPTNP